MTIPTHFLRGRTQARLLRLTQQMQEEASLGRPFPVIAVGTPMVLASEPSEGATQAEFLLEVQHDFGNGPVPVERSYRVPFDHLEFIPDSGLTMPAYAEGDEVTVVADDPLFNTACVAKPPIGTKGIVRGTHPKYPALLSVEFYLPDLGYEASEDREDDLKCLYYPRKCLQTAADAIKAEAVRRVLTALREPPKEEPVTDRTEYVFETNGHWGLPERVSFADIPDGFDRLFDSALRRVVRSDLWAKDENHELYEVFNAEREQCFVCGERFGVRRSGPKSIKADKACPLPGGMPVYDVLLAIPSGVIVIANDLRPLVTVDEDHDIGNKISERKYIEEYARFGMAHVYTGNSCPTIWRQGERIAIANYTDEEDRYEYEGKLLPEGEITPVAERGEDLGTVCTDLWWYSAMDRDLFLARCAEEGLKPENFSPDYITVEPGTYAFSIEPVQRDSASEVFSYITRTDREAPPLAQRDLSVAATLKESQAWIALDRLMNHSFVGRSLPRAIEYVLCTIGNGYDWDKGFLISTSRNEDQPYKEIDENSPTEHPLFKLMPEYDFKYGKGEGMNGEIYPFSYRFGAIMRMPEEIDPWWLSLIIIFARSTMDRPESFHSSNGYDPAKFQTMMRQVLAQALEIMDRRGGIDWLAPYLEEWADKRDAPPRYVTPSRETA